MSAVIFNRKKKFTSSLKSCLCTSWTRFTFTLRMMKDGALRFPGFLSWHLYSWNPFYSYRFFKPIDYEKDKFETNITKGVIHSQHYLKNYHYLLLKFNELFNEKWGTIIGSTQLKYGSWKCCEIFVVGKCFYKTKNYYYCFNFAVWDNITLNIPDQI